MVLLFGANVRFVQGTNIQAAKSYQAHIKPDIPFQFLASIPRFTFACLYSKIYIWFDYQEFRNSNSYTFEHESIKLLMPYCFHGYFSFTSAIHSCTTRQSNLGDLYLIGKKRFDTDWYQFCTWGPNYGMSYQGKQESHLPNLYFEKNLKSTFIPRCEFLVFECFAKVALNIN